MLDALPLFFAQGSGRSLFGYFNITLKNLAKGCNNMLDRYVLKIIKFYPSYCWKYINRELCIGIKMYILMDMLKWKLLECVDWMCRYQSVRHLSGRAPLVWTVLCNCRSMLVFHECLSLLKGQIANGLLFSASPKSL